jgi:hypothetical protein
MTVAEVSATVVVYVGVAVCLGGSVVAALAILTWCLEKVVGHGVFYRAFVEFLFERQKQRRNRRST